MEKKKLINYAEAPTFFGKCLAEGCTAAGQCLRYQAAQVVSEKENQLMVVSPKRIRPSEGEQCPCFVEIRLIRMARGFKRALGTVRVDKAKELARALMALHGRRTYYKWLKGEIALDADNQRRVAAIMERYGAQQPIVFDEYEEVPMW